jgi:hypothetical protein
MQQESVVQWFCQYHQAVYQMKTVLAMKLVSTECVGTLVTVDPMPNVSYKIIILFARAQKDTKATRTSLVTLVSFNRILSSLLRELVHLNSVS